MIHLDVPEADGEIHVKAGHLHGAPAYAVKVASGFYAEDPAGDRRARAGVRRRERARPSPSCSTAGCSPTCARARPAASPRGGSRPTDVDGVAVLGTGIQARRQVEALAVRATRARPVRLWGRDMDRAMRAAHDIGAMVVGLGAGGRDAARAS